MNTSNKEERRKHLFKIAHRLRHGEALGEVEAVNILEDLITKHEVEARKESEELASAYAKIIACVYDGEKIEDCEPRIMAELQKKGQS